MSGHNLTPIKRAPETYKRRAYLIGLGIVIALGLLANFFAPEESRPAQRVLWLSQSAWLGLLAILFWLRKENLRPLEIALFASVACYFTLRLSLYVLSGSSDVNQAFASLGYWFPTLYALAFLMFGAKNGARVSVGFYLLSAAIGAIGVTRQLMSGTSIDEFTALVQMYTSGGVMILLFVTFTKLTEIHTGLASAMEFLANTDALTRLANRRRLEQLLTEAKERADRYPSTFSVVMVDLDHFKEVNDRLGHDTGDLCLKEVARLLRSGIRSVDQAGRWGGEEFVLLMPDTNLSEALQSAWRLNYTFASHIFERVGLLTASFGVAEYRRGEDIESLIRRADRALYEAKAVGRNTVRPKPPTPQTPVAT
jgi:diguanylate cyclase (GGDEF)-like protein